MTDIEKQFFETFGIEPKHYDGCKLEDKYFSDETIQKQYITFDDYLAFECPHFGEGCYSTCEYAYQYEQHIPITACALIELICILSPNSFFSTNTDDLKIEILSKCLKRERDENIRKQIRALFTEAGE